MSTSALRPSLALYTRQHPLAAELLDEDANAFGWGYEMGKADALDSGLPPLTDAEMACLWHPDYSEGYRDGYGDYSKDGVLPFYA